MAENIEQKLDGRIKDKDAYVHNAYENALIIIEEQAGIPGVAIRPTGSSVFFLVRLLLSYLRLRPQNTLNLFRC